MHNKKDALKTHISVHMGRNLVSAELLNPLSFQEKLILGKECSKASSCSDICCHPRMTREKGIGQDFHCNLMM